MSNIDDTFEIFEFFAYAILLFMPQGLAQGFIGHEAIVRILEASLKDPAPAYLLVGPAHLGKRDLAERYVRVLLGLEVTDPHWRAHPDVFILEVAEGKSQISVEQVRELRERVSLRPMRALRLVVLIPAADRLNESGTNALLKVIEEPPAGAVFVMVAEDVGRLPLTVRSRSVVLPFGSVPLQAIALGLEARGINPTEAMARAQGSRGRPGLAIDSQNVTAGGSVFARQFLQAKNAGFRLSFTEELARACDASVEPATAWREALLFAMRELGAWFGRDPQRALVLGLAVLASLRAVGTAVSPRLALDACAVRLDADVPADLPHLMSALMPKPISSIYLQPTI
jgi:hypothetical protein